MAISKMQARLPYNVQTVWETVTNLTDCTWRSDLSRIAVVDERRFVEYTKDGYATKFTVTQVQACARWAFHMENSNMKGSWVGTFTAGDGWTEVVFTEDVSAKKLWMKPFVGMYLKKQQARYIEDLRRALAK